MKQIVCAVVAVLVLSTQANAWPYNWTTEDIITQGAFISLLVVDWGQTLNIADEPTKFSESNIILGEHPSRENIHIYNMSVIVLHTSISYVLPPHYRSLWQHIWVGIEIGMIINNMNIGMTWRF